MTISLLPLDSLYSWIGVTVLFPVPTSPIIRKCFEKSIESRIEKMGSFDSGRLSADFSAWPSTLPPSTAGKRSAKSTSSFTAKGTQAHQNIISVRAEINHRRYDGDGIQASRRIERWRPKRMLSE